MQLRLTSFWLTRGPLLELLAAGAMPLVSAGVGGGSDMSGVRRVVSCRRIYDPETPELQASLLKPQLSGKAPL